MASESRSKAQPVSVLETKPNESLLDAVVENGRLGQTPDEKVKGKEWIKELVDQVLEGQIQVNEDTDRMLAERIQQLDELISGQLNEVMHARSSSVWKGRGGGFSI